MGGFEHPEQCNAKTDSHCPFNAGDIFGISHGGKAGAVVAGGAKSDAAGVSQAADLAKSSIGQQLWQGSGLTDGRLGSAASVSSVLQKAGLLDHQELSVNGLASTLSDPKTNDWQRVDINQRKPGDVIIISGSLPARNLGIVDSDGKIMTNHSSTGQWGEMYPGYLEHMEQRPNTDVYALRPKTKE